MGLEAPIDQAALQAHTERTGPSQVRSLLSIGLKGGQTKPFLHSLCTKNQPNPRPVKVAFSTRTMSSTKWAEIIVVDVGWAGGNATLLLLLF